MVRWGCNIALTFYMEVLMKLTPDTIQRHQCRHRERCARKTCEKGDARRYPQHTLALDPQQPELALEKPDARNA